MRFRRSKREQGRIEFGIIYGSIAGLILLAGRFLPLSSLAPACAFRALTGFPCPTCGSTRSIVNLAHGDIPSALAMNPLTGMAALGAVAVLFYSLFSLAFSIPIVTIDLSEREKDWMRAAAVVVLLFNWLYLALAL
jgi:hypothetical protein